MAPSTAVSHSKDVTTRLKPAVALEIIVMFFHTETPVLPTILW